MAATASHPVDLFKHNGAFSARALFSAGAFVSAGALQREIRQGDKRALFSATYGKGDKQLGRGFHMQAWAVLGATSQR